MLDMRTLDNWVRIKRSLEQAGKTDTFFYRRAVAILRGRPDPLTNTSPLFVETDYIADGWD